MWSRKFFATTASGLEGVLAAEVRAAGGGVRDVRTHFAGVSFASPLETVYRLNLESHVALRVLLRLATFECATPEALYTGVRRAVPNWAAVVRPEQTLRVDATGSSAHAALRNDMGNALVGKDAIVDAQRFCTRARVTGGARSNIAKDDPDVLVNLFFDGATCSVLVDSTGPSLGRRGYRLRAGEAPLSEVLAAGLLKLMGFRGDEPLVDLMCGSGTVALEASLLATRTAPGLLRTGPFAFERWPDFDAKLWSDVRTRARSRQLPAARAPPIVASDIDAEVIAIAQDNAVRCGQAASHVQFLRRAVADARPPAGVERGFVFCNPPYGKRLGSEDDAALVQVYADLGLTLREHFRGWNAFVLVGDTSPVQAMGLSTPVRAMRVQNGGLRCNLLRYDLM